MSLTGIAASYGIPVQPTNCRIGRDGLRRNLDEQATIGRYTGKIYLDNVRFYLVSEECDRHFNDTFPEDLARRIRNGDRIKLHGRTYQVQF